jgi:cellulose synthase/poly-beta-1,6-N-acetylglucosamine synthase-like glycosyltransferase
MFELVDIFFMFFVFISIYFTLLFLSIFFKKRNEMEGYEKAKQFPFVSIIVPAYNEEKTIRRTIENLKKIDYPNYEIIVVNDGSKDRTSQIAKRCGVKVIDKINTGKADSLNVALSSAKGKIVAVVDADSFPKKDCLRKTVGYFQDPKVGAVTVTALVKKPRNLLQNMQKLEYAMIAWNRKLLDFIDSVYVTPGTLSLYRKKLLLELGGFDRNCLTEDIEMTWRIEKAGYIARMAFSTKTYTIVPESLKKWFRQRVRWTIGGFQTLFKHKDTFLKKKYKMLGLFICPFFLLGFVLSLLALGIYSSLYFNWGLKKLLFFYEAFSLGVSKPIKLELLLLPNVFTIFGTIIFILSLVYVLICLKSLKIGIINMKNLFYILLYLVLYLTTFPFIIIFSLIKMWRKKYEW